MVDEEFTPLRVLFVCMGNICRSPMAEGVFRHRWRVRLDEINLKIDISVDSAGTHSYHVGSAPDARAQAAAARRGVDISALSARSVAPDDFAQFDYILAMDVENLEYLMSESDTEYRDKIKLFRDYSATSEGGEVPDPYYGGTKGFERVLDLIEDATDGLVDALLEESGLKASGAKASGRDAQ